MNKNFITKGDEFVKQVETIHLDSDTEVSLQYHCVNESGEACAFSTIISTPTKVVYPNHKKVATEMASVFHRGNIIDNIKTLVYYIPDGFVFHKDAPEQVLLKIIDVELVIKQGEQAW